MNQLIITASVIFVGGLSGLSHQLQPALAQTTPGNRPETQAISTVEQHQKQKLGSSQNLGSIEVSPDLKPTAASSSPLPVKTIERPSTPPSMVERILPQLGAPTAVSPGIFDQQLGRGFGFIRADL